METTPLLRALSYRSHIILYEVDPDRTVTVLRIRHGREDWVSEPL